MKIIIIGAGPGGYETALEAAKRGIETVLIEQGNVGGTCLNEGCIPTKVLCRSAEVLEEARSAGEFGVRLYDIMSSANPDSAGTEECGSVRIDFGKVQNRKAEVVAQLRSGVHTLLDNKLITLVKGRAVIKDAHTVTVSGSQEEYSADCIIVATGSSPAALNVPGGDLPGILTSREILDIGDVPGSLCIIGAGVIGLEFASVFSSFGSRVTVVEYCGQILPRFDSDLAKRLKQSLTKRKIEIITSAAVKSLSCVSVPSAGYKIEYESRGNRQEVVAEKVLVAVGRCPNVQGIGLENAGVEYTAKGIQVDENMRTACPSVYAIGDVTGRMMLAHVATSQGLRALDHICGWHGSIGLSVVPSAVFTIPEAAAVGLTEDECKEKHIACKVMKSFFRSNGKAVAMGQTDGFVKIVTADCRESVQDETAPSGKSGDMGGNPVYRDGQILGCHIFGPHAADLIAEMAAFISMGATVEDLRSTIHAHPTLSEVFRI